MNAVSKFVRLPPARRRLLLRAGLAVAGYRAALDLLPFRWVHGAAAHTRRKPARGGRLAPEQYAWAVQAAARRVPRATCLTQALALRSLLAADGRPSALRLGVARERRAFEAHAWLESEGRILIGGGDVQRFTPLPTPAREA